MDLELSSLHSFLVLCETQHFGLAAEHLHISQPALSKQLQRLEERLGGRLVDRNSRHFSLTAAGAILRESAQNLLREVEQTEALVQLALEGRSGFLRIGFGIATLAAGLAELLREYKKIYPEVRISMKDMSTPAQLKALEDDSIDVGFVRLPVLNPNLLVRPLVQETLVVALPSSLDVNPKLGLKGLAEQPFVTLQRSLSQSFDNHFLSTCQAAGFTARIIQEASELLTVLHLVGAGFGVALVPQAISHMAVPHVKFMDTLVTSATWDIGIVRRRDRNDELVDKFVSLAVSSQK